MRIRILKIIIVILFLITALDLVYHQVLKGWYFYQLSISNHIRIVPLLGKRGRILDRNGVVLADNRISFNVTITPQDIQNGEELFTFLSHVLQIDKKELLRRYQQKKFAPFAPVVVAEDIPRELAFMIAENKFRFPSLSIEEELVRYYLYEESNAHVLGYVGKINQPKIERLKDYGYTTQSIVGYSGVEEYYDAYLKGGDGGLQIEVNSRGQQVRLLGFKQPQQGEEITLTIDNRIQQIAADVLKDTPGTVVVLDRDNGEVLAMSNSPSFDPNLFVSARESNQAVLLFSDPGSPLLNRAIKGQFPPGSVFKVPLAIGALYTGKIVPSTSFICPGYYQLGRRQFRCSHVHGIQELHTAIVHSCNVYFGNVGLLMGPDRINKYARIFGLGRLTDIDLPYEELGFIPGRHHRKGGQRQWYNGDTLNFSVGQGEVLVTPLQLVRMMVAVAEDGKMVQPHVLKTIGSKRVEQYFLPKYIDIDKKVFNIVQTALQSVVSDPTGTAHILNIDGIPVAGKTGTAQTSGEKKNHAWFIGYTQTEKMKIAFGVFLEHSGSSYYACQVARELLLRMQAEHIL